MLNVEITAGMIPRRTSEKQKRAVFSATTMSQTATRPMRASEGRLLHPADDGQGAFVDRAVHGRHRLRVGDVVLLGAIDRAAHPVHVGAGAEDAPFAAQHHGAQPRLRPRRPNTVRQIGDHLFVERVADLRAIETARGPRRLCTETYECLVGPAAHGRRFSLHPEHGVGGFGHRGVQRRREREPDDRARLGRIDDAVVPQARRGVIGMSLLDVLGAHGIADFGLLFG